MVVMPVNSYRFHSVWPVACPPAEVFEVLADLRSYLEWWPEVRAARQTGELAAELRCRSLLPYDLVFEVRHNTRDPDRLVLRADLVGDLDGTAGWTLLPHGDGTKVVYDQEVVVRKPLLRALGPLLRPLLKANHELMMRHGRRGLNTYLAGVRAARRG